MGGFAADGMDAPDREAAASRRFPRAMVRPLPSAECAFADRRCRRTCATIRDRRTLHFSPVKMEDRGHKLQTETDKATQGFADRYCLPPTEHCPQSQSGNLSDKSRDSRRLEY
jgi:hypothetical protein